MDYAKCNEVIPGDRQPNNRTTEFKNETPDRMADIA